MASTPVARQLAADADGTTAISRLTESLDSALRTSDTDRCQQLIGDALLELHSDHDALDVSLFDIFGSVVRCADLPGPTCSLVQAYLQLVLEHCTGREVLTVLMSALDASSGDPWGTQNTLLAQTAVKVICALQRQQTRLLADYLQVLLNVARSASISDALLDSLNNTVAGLKPTLLLASKQPYTQDNQLLLCCFALQLMLCTLTAPVQQTNDFHINPNFNGTLSSLEQASNRQLQPAVQTSLVQHVMQWLCMLHADTYTELSLLLKRLRHPSSGSKVPDMDDAPFLDLVGIEVGAALAVYAKYCVKGCATSAVRSDDNSATDILSEVQQHSSKLLQVASDHQEVVIAQKALAVIAAASNRVAAFPEADRARLDDSVHSMVQFLEVTMVQHPVESLRNMAFWTLDSLLNALELQSSTSTMQQLLNSDSPGVAALMLHRLQQQADKCWGLTSDARWQLLQPMLLESVLAWIDPHGSHGWAPPSSLMKNVEPICAAVNLCRFLLLREGAHNSKWTEVCSLDSIKSLRNHVHLLTSAVQAAQAKTEDFSAPDIETMLAVSRCLEVLSRLSELLDRPLLDKPL